MAYYFELDTVFGMGCGCDRSDASRQPWHFEFSVRNWEGPIQQFMRPHFPTRIWPVARDHVPVPRVLPWGVGGGGLIFVSDLVRAVIDELEPGVHQFVPLTLEHEGKAEPFHMLRIATFLPAVDADRSEVDWKEIELPGGGTTRRWRKKYRVPLRLDPDIFGRHHLWREANGRTMTFMSDHLHQALAARDLLRGLYVEKQITD